MAYNFTEFLKRVESGGIEAALGRYYSLYPAVVVDNKDPKKRGRLKIAVPQLTAGVINKWAHPVTSITGKNSGFISVPEKDANIWIVFRNGDPRFPIWLGGWWLEEGAPADAKTDDYPAVHVWQIPNGSKVLMNDKTGEVLLSDKNGNALYFDGNSVSKWYIKDKAQVQLNGQVVELNGADEAAVLGNKLQAELNTLNAKFEALCGALAGWTPSGNPIADIAALKLAISAPVAMTAADFSAILSAIVKLK